MRKEPKLILLAQRTKAYFTGDKELAKQAAKDGERIQVLSKADWLTEMATQKLEGSEALKDLLKGDVRDFMDDLVKARQELEENGNCRNRQPNCFRYNFRSRIICYFQMDKKWRNAYFKWNRKRS